MKGIVEFEVQGKKRGFKFGTYAMSIACEMDGDCDLTTLFRRCGFHGGSARKVRLKSLLYLFYGAAVHYAEDKGIPVDFKTAHVSDWIDEMGPERVNEILNDNLLHYEPKNSESPAETGETVA